MSSSILPRSPAIAAVAAMVALAACNGAPLETTAVAGASTIVLRLPGDDALRRAAVAFDHGKHERAMKKGCATCHPKDAKGRLSPYLGRTAPGKDRDKLMNLYHDRCISCHKERSSQGKALPQACGECHSKKRIARKTAWRPVAMDHSLHRRHVLATGEKQCQTCHHVYDKKAQKLVYNKGAEGACGQCHGEQTKDKTPSLRLASHQSCIGCHLERAAKKQQSGPMSCDGCHEGGRQAAYKKLAKVPRLSIGQKDRVEIKTPGAKAAAVSFDHKLHEGTTFCTTCHHSAIEPCGKCHERLGARKAGGGITLERAHHAASSKRSCVGCHNKQLRKKDCAGCHHALGKSTAARACATCHRAPGKGPRKNKSVGPRPPRHPAGKARGGRIVAPCNRRATMPAGMDRRPNPGSYSCAGPRAAATLAPLPAASDAFPETVEIKVLAHRYKPSMLPHRKIVEKLRQGTEGSKLARSFHGRTEALCAGCHHNTPVGQRPPACKSCHDHKADKATDRPSLKTAYHRQCIGCHQKMGIKEQGCTDCHAEAGGRVKR